jgi:spermidine synthase
MTVTPNEINTIQPAVRQSRGKVLTYGLGLGYYAFHCLMKAEVTSVTVVERSPEVIDLFRRLILPGFPRQADLHIVQADAFDYAAHVMPREGFDTVFTDLWRDVADGIPLYLRMKALEVPGPTYLYWMEKTLQACMD